MSCSFGRRLLYSSDFHSASSCFPSLSVFSLWSRLFIEVNICLSLAGGHRAGIVGTCSCVSVSEEDLGEVCCGSSRGRSFWRGSLGRLAASLLHVLPADSKGRS